MACPLYGEHYALRLSFLAVTLASFSTLIDSALTKFPFVKWLYYAKVCNELTKSRKNDSAAAFFMQHFFFAFKNCIHNNPVWQWTRWDYPLRKGGFFASFDYYLNFVNISISLFLTSV